ncbi:phage tail protein [Oceanirhabdus seepicola]|uniref:Tail fiber protein n=1 Tax=Oceanirhabdus seepicola TaxID=2828781 RepID=A0A9J6NZ30_9CLOT|nr:phage tail protein [Oceanirhabdus seepicola]MCM1988869.1 tail fiber protein [Oceanirhabdus seepicola]
MNQMLGEIKLFPYDDVPVGFHKCMGQALYINKYPKLYMLLGTKFGKGDNFQFRLPDLTEDAPKSLTYCIATEGKLPEIHCENGHNVQEI